jgi:hypothetical protein
LWIDIHTVASNILQWKRLIITGYILTYFATIQLTSLMFSQCPKPIAILRFLKKNSFNSSKLPSALLAVGSLERSELLKEVTLFSKLQNHKLYLVLQLSAYHNHLQYFECFLGICFLVYIKIYCSYVVILGVEYNGERGYNFTVTNNFKAFCCHQLQTPFRFTKYIMI